MSERNDDCGRLPAVALGAVAEALAAALANAAAYVHNPSTWQQAVDALNAYEVARRG